MPSIREDEMSPSNADNLEDYRASIGILWEAAQRSNHVPQMRLSFYPEIASNAFVYVTAYRGVDMGCFALFLHSCFAKRLADFTLLYVHHMEQGNFCTHHLAPLGVSRVLNGRMDNPSRAGLEDTGISGVRFAFISFGL